MSTALQVYTETGHLESDLTPKKHTLVQRLFFTKVFGIIQDGSLCYFSPALILSLQVLLLKGDLLCFIEQVSIDLWEIQVREKVSFFN